MIRTIFILFCFWCLAGIFSPFALIFCIFDLFGMYKLIRPIMGVMCRAWAYIVFALIGVKPKIDGLENVPKNERICFVANHEGDFDILLMLAFMPQPVAFIAKSQTIWFPFLNIWILALGSSFIHRDSLRKSAKAIERGVKSIKSGHAMVIFPEGTRSRGPFCNPFKKGSFKLATRSEALLIPVTIRDSYKIWEEHHRICKADVTITIHPPIQTKGLSADEKRALPEKVQKIVEDAL